MSPTKFGGQIEEQSIQNIQPSITRQLKENKLMQDHPDFLYSGTFGMPEESKNHEYVSIKDVGIR